MNSYQLKIRGETSGIRDSMMYILPETLANAFDSQMQEKKRGGAQVCIKQSWLLWHKKNNMRIEWTFSKVPTLFRRWLVSHVIHMILKLYPCYPALFLLGLSSSWVPCWFVTQNTRKWESCTSFLVNSTSFL